MEKISVKKVKEKVEASEFVVIYAFSKQCQACKEFTPLLENELLPNAKTDVKFYKLDLSDKRQNQEELKAFADNVQLDSIPFMAVFVGGVFRGADNFSSEEGFNQLITMVNIFKSRQNENM